MMRDELLQQLWEAQDEAYTLMNEYDSLPHQYGDVILYQAEAYIVNLVGQHPGITTTEIAVILNKTPSACSQIVRKLREKGFVEQSRNPKNNRLYNLFLTKEGALVYQNHLEVNCRYRNNTFKMLEHFTDEELENHIRVQRKLNEAYRYDVQHCKDKI